MDYGVSWEEAWEQHVDDWTPGEKNKRIDSVKRWNDEEGPIKIMSGDLRKRAIHDSITTGCVFWDGFAEDEKGYHEYFEDSEDWPKITSTLTAITLIMRVSGDTARMADVCIGLWY